MSFPTETDTSKKWSSRLRARSRPTASPGKSGLVSYGPDDNEGRSVREHVCELLMVGQALPSAVSVAVRS